MPKSPTLKNIYLNLLLGESLGVTIPLTPWMGILTTLPQADATGFVEASGGGYTRVNVASYYPAASGLTGAVTNASDIPLGTPTANLGNAKGIAIFTAQSGGQLLRWAVLTPAFDLVANSPIVIAAGSGTFGETN